ncbi:MAG: hypothetical protein EOO38_06610 [Cytophagaceae bacterium]|nr:MAG: hypothetical protein EOO38_06610 [Cytophagaceae bacterium]
MPRLLRHPSRLGANFFRVTGITEHLRNGGRLRVVKQMVNHESLRITGLCDRRSNQILLDEVERILI